MIETLSYDDVLLQPRLGVLNKRRDADISTELFADIPLDIPILSAPMTSVTGPGMCNAMRQNGGIGVLPRFGWSIEESVAIAETHAGNKCLWAIGLDLERYEALYSAGVRWFCFDVAHAHHKAVGAFLSALPHRDDIFLMAGNVGTQEGAQFLADLGVDAIKVGIGPGAACRTREVTGFGIGQLSAVIQVANFLRNDHSATSVRGSRITIVADGGIKNSGDIVKALAAGADSVMLGKLLAQSNEAPGNGQYYGMASKRINGHYAPEGAEGTVELRGPVRDILKELTWGLKSGISYAGATNLHELRENAVWQRVTPAVRFESSVRL